MSYLMRVDDLLHYCKNCGGGKKDIILEISYYERMKLVKRTVYMNGEYYIADGCIFFQVGKNLQESEKNKINNKDFIDLMERECVQDPESWGSLYRSPMDMLGSLEVIFVNNLTEYDCKDYSINDFLIENDNIVIKLFQEEVLIYDNIANIIKENLENIQNKNADFDYEIYADVSEFPEIVSLGATYKERLQILIMLYYVNPTLKEIRKLDIEQVFDYIKETNEYYERDKKYFKECMYLITEKLI